MDATSLGILRRVADGPLPCVFDGGDAVLAAELVAGGLVEGRVARHSNGRVMSVGVLGLTPAGRDALAAHSGRFGRWLLARLDSVFTAFATAFVTAFATAWVTAHFTAAKEVSRLMPDDALRDFRGEPERRRDGHPDYDKPLPEAHHTNSVPLPAVQKQRADGLPVK